MNKEQWTEIQIILIPLPSYPLRWKNYGQDTQRDGGTNSYLNNENKSNHPADWRKWDRRSSAKVHYS